MERREKRRIWYWLSLFCVAGAAILIGYFFGLKKGLGEREVLLKREVPSAVIRPEGESRAASGEKKTYAIKRAESIKPSDLPETCGQIEKNMLKFFKHLDQKDYIRQMNAGLDTFKVFREIIRKLSSQPPIPAGEALDSFVLSKNVFYFYRLLDKKEIQLIKEILKNETDILELNLDLFYKWLTTGNGCPDKSRIKPSMDVLYPYAGYLINSIGGRAYLFRRRPALRLLVSYYCLLIVNEADKTRKNSYGIDISPQIAMLREEMSYHHDFYFQKTYLKKLDDLSNYYIERR